MYEFIKKIILLFSCKILFPVQYENEEIVTKYDKCMICPNHSNVFDPIFIYPKIPNMYTIGKSEIFKRKHVAKFLKYYHVFPIKRDKNDAVGVKKILELFHQTDKIRLVLFPEGRVIKKKEERGKIKDGAVYISSSILVPIIPVYITARPRFFSKVVVKFGNPIFPSKEVLQDKKILRQKSNQLLNSIYELEKE